MKAQNKIENDTDLDEFTEYVLNPANNESIEEVTSNSIITKNMIISIGKGMRSKVENRVIEIVNGELEYVAEESKHIQKYYKTITQQKQDLVINLK